MNAKVPQKHKVVRDDRNVSEREEGRREERGVETTDHVRRPCMSLR